jgi:hypothetical protein
MRISTALVLLLLVTQAGCWVRMPAAGPKALQSRVGSTAVVDRDLYLVDSGDSYTAVPYSEYNPEQKHAGKLPVGSEVRIQGLVSRRLPPGVVYFFVCRSDAVSRKFGVQAKNYWEQDKGSSCTCTSIIDRRGATTRRPAADRAGSPLGAAVGGIVCRIPPHRRASWWWLIAVVLSVVVFFLLYAWAASRAT